MRRRLLGGLAAAGSLLTLVQSGASASGAAGAAPPGSVVVIETRGWGHGVGMSQDGALAMAQDGASASDILGHFYPGTTLGRRGGATVRVGVSEAPAPAIVVSFPSGGAVRDAPSGAQPPGFPIAVAPGGSVELSLDGPMYRAKPLAGATLGPVAPPPPPPPAPVAPTPISPGPSPVAATPPQDLPNLLRDLLAPTTTVPPAPVAPPPTPAPPPAAGALPPPTPATGAVSGRGLWAMPRGGDGTVAVAGQDRRYRGVLQATGDGGGLKLVNQVDIELYLRGMGEVLDPGWPAAALQAQAIAARTYALRAGGELCSTQQCQVYLGAQAEYGAMNAAVQATRGQVLTYQGSLAQAVYSANDGGISATPEEGFGPDSADEPYLRPATHRTADPKVEEKRFDMGELGRRFGYGGEVSDVRVGRTGPSGRALEVVIDGSAGPSVVAGQRFWQDLSLQSTLYTIRVEAPPAEGEPVAPADGGAAGEEPAVGELSAPGVVAAPVGALGRSPWVALAVLLMSTWAIAAGRATGRLKA